jgi:virginiamycin B lyase
MWFTEGAGSIGNRIGRITTDGVITEFAVPTPASGPNTIRRGPDPHAAKYCRYEQDSMTDEIFTTRYGTFGLCVAELATTDTLWFTEFNGNRVARITTKGVIDEFVLPLPAGAPANATTGPIGITEGPDGAVWFAENAAIGNAIGRLDVDLYGQPAAPASAPSVALDASGTELLEIP